MAKTGRPCSKVLISDAELARLYQEEGLSTAQIGRLFDVDGTVIRYHMKRRGIPLRASGSCPGKLNRAWKGGRIEDKSGYILVHQPGHPDANSGGYVREHRLVMEQKLGRRLDPKEVVHHRDGDKKNNSPENLEMYGENSEHLREELTGRLPVRTPAGLERMREAGRSKASHPAWTEARREAARQRMMARWVKGKIPGREWTQEERAKQAERTGKRARKPDGSFE